MKPFLTSRKLKLLIPFCGILGLLLRALLVATGTDDKGLIVSNHPAWFALWSLTAAVMAALLLGVQNIRRPAHRVGFSRSVWGAAAGVPVAVCAMDAAIRHFRTGPVHAGPPSIAATAVFYLCGAVMALAAVSFIAAALCRLTERKPLFGLHVLVCLWFILEMLNLYQTWSFDPQLPDYCFQLFACIALTMTAYQRAAFDIRKASHRKLWFWGLSAVYLCALCLDSGLFFIAGGIWAFSNLPTPRRPRKSAENPTTD